MAAQIAHEVHDNVPEESESLAPGFGPLVELSNVNGLTEPQRGESFPKLQHKVRSEVECALTAEPVRLEQMEPEARTQSELTALDAILGQEESAPEAPTASPDARHAALAASLAKAQELVAQRRKQWAELESVIAAVREKLGGLPCTEAPARALERGAAVPGGLAVEALLDRLQARLDSADAERAAKVSELEALR
jgi:hypothetical protein